jgi:hypothetical protein
MHLEAFVEEPSAEAALKNLLPRLLPPAWNVRYHTFQGKSDLLSKLPSRLRGYTHWLPPDWRLLVLVDEDRQDCYALKEQLEHAAERAGLMAKTGLGTGPVEVLNRIAIEELEAWFLGDVEALVRAYPRVPRTLSKRQRFRNPDQVSGGTWEALEMVLQRAGYYPGGMPKVEVAQRVSAHMNPSRNSSRSFQVFVSGVRALVGTV